MLLAWTFSSYLTASEVRNILYETLLSAKSGNLVDYSSQQKIPDF